MMDTRDNPRPSRRTRFPWLREYLCLAQYARPAAECRALIDSIRSLNDQVQRELDRMAKDIHEAHEQMIEDSKAHDVPCSCCAGDGVVRSTAGVVIPCPWCAHGREGVGV
jgi:hypothetical protein